MFLQLKTREQFDINKLPSHEKLLKNTQTHKTITTHCIAPRTRKNKAPLIIFRTPRGSNTNNSSRLCQPLWGRPGNTCTHLNIKLDSWLEKRCENQTRKLFTSSIRPIIKSFRCWTFHERKNLLEGLVFVALSMEGGEVSDKRLLGEQTDEKMVQSRDLFWNIEKSTKTRARLCQPTIFFHFVQFDWFRVCVHR